MTIEKSVSGYIVYFLKCPVEWRSRSQKNVALNSTKAEYYGILDIITEILFMKEVLEFMEVEVNLPTIIRVDNLGAIYLSNNASSSARTKHIYTQYHFVKN